ncbi:hypothetical protein [Streptomyces sp. ISL-96]|uniref:hypothetical protein n=1 Tax=Streptomyces sp. ISL-96 TaxID=2819191 RepID=UPI00203509E7|nr:hypothetical protein [Streptomyces sp. ISL-96]
MNAIQQHMLDVYRAAQLGSPAPPAPGLNDWQVVREVRDHRRVRAVAENRPHRVHRLRAALANLFASPTRRSGRPRPVAGTGSSACG